jgi:hypothetical protein
MENPFWHFRIPIFALGLFQNDPYNPILFPSPLPTFHAFPPPPPPSPSAAPPPLPLVSTMTAWGCCVGRASSPWWRRPQTHVRSRSAPPSSICDAGAVAPQLRSGRSCKNKSQTKSRDFSAADLVNGARQESKRRRTMGQGKLISRRKVIDDLKASQYPFHPSSLVRKEGRQLPKGQPKLTYPGQQCDARRQRHQ